MNYCYSGSVATVYSDHCMLHPIHHSLSVSVNRYMQGCVLCKWIGQVYRHLRYQDEKWNSTFFYFSFCITCELVQAQYPVLCFDRVTGSVFLGLAVCLGVVGLWVTREEGCVYVWQIFPQRVKKADAQKCCKQMICAYEYKWAWYVILQSKCSL